MAGAMRYEKLPSDLPDADVVAAEPVPAQPPQRFKLGKQSSLDPHRDRPRGISDEDLSADVGVDGIRLMYLAHDGDLEGVRAMLDGGVEPNFHDADGRTALHVAACEGRVDVVELLLSRNARVDSEDVWGSTPLMDAIYYKNHEVINLLQDYGAKLKIVVPMRVSGNTEVPEYEIEPSELDFYSTANLSKGTFRVAMWHGIKVAVKQLDGKFMIDNDKIMAFRDELAMLQLIRHPNVVQFLGAVTQTTPMMIVTEYLQKGDFAAFLKRKGTLKPHSAVNFALEISRGMNYVHEHKPEAIIHGDLKPSNILIDDSRHLKVADFGVGKFLTFSGAVKEEKPMSYQDDESAGWYAAPEILRNEKYDRKVDVFSFALILQEMIEGCPPFQNKERTEVEKAYSSGKRPPFKAPMRRYAHGLKDLIEQCWKEKPAERPTFKEIIERLSDIKRKLQPRKGIKVKSIKCIPVEVSWQKDSSQSTSHTSQSTSSWQP